MTTTQLTPETVTDGPLPYLRYLPQVQPGANLPLLLFLHGSGKRGGDLAHVADEGVSDILAHLPEPTLVLVPQCPDESRWTEHLGALEAILDDTAAQHPVDTKRVYLTGLSLGGQGTWSLAAHAPQRFAALAPVCGRSNPADAGKLKDHPIWVFHGDRDEVVPLSESAGMVEALREFGSTVQFTIFPATGHDSWTPAYTEPNLYTWLFAQRRSS